MQFVATAIGAGGTPNITSAGTASGTAYTAFSFTVTADNGPTSYAATGLPAGLSINTANGVISGTPTTPGTYNASVSAANGQGGGTASPLTITIAKNPGAPTITSALTANAVAGQSFSYQIVANNSPTGYGATNLPTGLAVDTTSGIISGTPTAAGTRNVTITATNSLGLDSQTLVITTTAPPTVTSSTAGSIMEGGSFAYQITASATPAVTSYGATNLPAGISIDTATGAITGTVATAGTYTFTVSATNDSGTGSASYTLKVLSQAEQDAIPLTVVINKYVNATPDKVELLVVGDGTPGSTVDMRGMIIKDTSSSMANDSGGKFEFSTSSLWASVRAGTLIVLTPGSTASEDLTTGGSDFNLAANLGNTNNFTARGGTFDIAATEMVILKAAGYGSDGVAGGIHSLAGGSTGGAQYTAFTGKKLRSSTASASNTDLGVYVNNANAVVSDYYPATDGTGATGAVAVASMTFGSFNTAGNDAFIKTLRGIVDGSGIASIVNGLSGSAYLGKNVFPRNQLGQTVDVVFTPSSTATAIQQLEIEVPALFGVPIVGNVTVSGTGTGSATKGVAGQKITIGGLNAISPNPVTIRIAGLSSPDTSDAVTNNGSYTFNIRSAGVGGSLAALGVSPAARVIIPIANLKNVDPTTRVPVLNGQTVAVEGVCLVGRLGTGSTSTVLQEGNSGVQVYSLSAVPGPQTRGNKYTAVGVVGQNFGITQITMTDASLMFDQGADVLPAPTVVTIPVFNAAPETYENRLIRIENLTYVSGTFGTSQSVIFQDTSLNQLTVRIQSASTATAQPNGTVTITGIGGQFDSTSPFDTGYQLQPRDVDDMPAPPSITSTAFSGTVGVVFSNKISSVGTPVITASNGLPAGLSLDSATGLITGTPTSAATNGVAFGFIATNAYGTNSANITFTIAKGTPTVASAPTASAITEGQTLNSSILTGGSATGIGSTALSGTFGWNSPTFVPPLGTANYGVVFTPSGADANNWNVSGNVNVGVTVNAAPSGSTFGGAYPGKNLTEVAPNGLTYLVNYAFGGDANTEATLPVQDNGDSTKLRLIVVVRTDDTSLTVGGQTSTSLTGGWVSAGVTVTDGDNTGLAPNLARKVISVDRGSDPKKFIRVAVTK